MSLHTKPFTAVPEETARVARAAFPQGNLYIRMRDEIGMMYEDEAFAPLFSPRGQPAEAPWRLALVTIMQYAEGLPDRQAADAVRSRIDWKYALNLELTDPGFDHTVLSEFRTRLITGSAEQLLLTLGRALSAFRRTCLVPNYCATSLLAKKIAAKSLSAEASTTRSALLCC